MPNVPNVPGVPSLNSYSGATVALAIADAGILLSTVLPTIWGIFINGTPVIIPATQLTQTIAPLLSTISQVAALVGLPNIVPVLASTVEFEYSGKSPISNYQQEAGAFQGYNKVQLPAEISLKIACGGSTSQRQGFLSTLEALRTSLALVDIVTPEQVFSGYNVTQYDYRRRAENGVTLIVADVRFELVPVTASATFQNTQQPGNAGPQAIGNVQPQTAPASFTQRFNTLGGAT